MQPSFNELKRIAANQAETIKQQNDILANQQKDLRNKQMGLEMERMRFDESKHADIRHQFNQSWDFAIRSLPWWRRGTKTVANRATEIMLSIRREAAKHIAMQEMERKLAEEALEKEAAEKFKLSDNQLEAIKAEVSEEEPELQMQ